jgi:hypothetical protein
VDFTKLKISHSKYKGFSFIYSFYIFIALIVCSTNLFSQKDIDDVKKQAESAFKDENYVEAYKLYSQLVANFSKEPLYNYRLGVSMIYAEPDKKKCIPYLEFAVKFVQKKETPPEALFYLAKAYHINYRFNDAIKYYKEYKQSVSASKAKEMEVDKEIAACENGKKLLSNIKELVILSKKQLNENEYFRSYDLSTIGGKLLVKPDEFQSKIDKKKKDKSVVYLPQQGDKVFFSSYGDDGKNGRDIYFAIRLPNGTFAKPQPLSAINTPYDEDYPFLHPNGKVLYFASKGHKGMGGYDIFKTTFDPVTQTWSPPENLEFPINSPGDDFLFVTDSSEKIAYFSTSRYSPPGKIDVLKVKTERVPPLFVAIKGNVRKNDVNQSVRSVIAVKNVETGELVGTFAADENGEYYMELPNGGKFLFTVETPGFTKQSEVVNLPLSYAIKPFRQSISYEKNVLVITNYFDEKASDDAYLDIVELIEKKAKLETNEEQFKQQTQQTSQPIANTNTTSTQETQNNINKKEEISASNTPIPPNNVQELLNIVKKDAEEAQAEANQLEIENNQLKQVVQLKEQELKDIDKNIKDTQNQLNTADSKEEKEQLTKLLKDLEDKKKTATEQKQFFEQYQKEVEQNLASKKKEAELNQQFANTLQELDKGKNQSAAIKKLEELQKELQQLEKQKSNESEVLSSLNKQEKETQEELNKIQKQKNNIEEEINLINEELKNLNNELTTTKDKALKENIQSQIKEKEGELSEKQNLLSQLNEQISDKNDDLKSIQEQKELVNKIKKNEQIPLTQNKSNQTSDDTKIITSSNINNIVQEYNSKINNASSNENKKQLIEEYNQLLTKSIKENNKKISSTTNQNERQKLQNLNYELEQILKSNNDQLLALNKSTTQPNSIPTNTTSTQPIATQTTTPTNTTSTQPIATQTTSTNTTSTQPITTQTTSPSNTTSTQPIANKQSDNKANNLPIPINNQQELINNISQQEQLKSEFTALKNQFENQTYQSPNSSSYKQNLPQINENPATKNIINILNANNQINFFNKQVDSLRSVSSEFKNKANKTNDNNQKQKLLSDAKKLDVAALEKEYQSAQFTKTLNQNLFNLYEESINNLPENQKQELQSELNKAKQNFKQAQQIRQEAANQSNLTIKLAAEQNAQEKEQVALNSLNQLFTDKKISLPIDNIQQSLQTENNQITEKHISLQNQFIKANIAEINYLISIADTSQKIKSTTSLSQSFSQLLELKKNIDQQLTASNNNKEQLNNIINNQLQLLQQLRQINNSIQPSVTQTNNYITKEETQKLITNNANKDSSIAIAQKLPLNINNNSAQQITSLIQEQKQIEDNLKTDNPILKTPDEIQKENEKLNTEITQLTNKALTLKQQITQTTDQRKKAELQTEFDRTNALIQEKKITQMSNEILINQAEYNANQNYLNQLISSIPSNNSTEKNSALNTINEIQKLKKQEESLIKEALALNNPSAQLGALQNARIKQQEYLQTQEELAKQLSKYNPQLTKQPSKVNVNDPLALTLKYKSNLNKQIKEWEAINNNLNMEITRLYPKYSTTPSGKLLADAQNIINQAKNTNDLNKKLELYTKAVQLQQTALQQLSTPIASNNQAQPNNTIAQNKAQQNQAQTNNNITQNKAQQNQPQPNNNIAQNKTTQNQPQLNNTIAQNITQQNQPPSNNNLAQNKTQQNQAQPNNNIAQNQTQQNQTQQNNFLPQIKSVKISRTPAYSDANPIPLNPKLPDGLIFSVQVGAFKNPLPNNFFNGLSPVFSQTTENNLYRYLVGQMTDPQEAIALKNNFRNLGYTDAFVIAYYNGKRISLSEALELLKKQNSQVANINPFATTNVLEKAQIPTYSTLIETTQQNTTETNIKECEEINDLYFTIQIGVYGKNVSDATFKYIKPIIRSTINDKFYRYSAGIYDNISQAQKDLQKVIALGMKDAFICAYWNGKRLFYPEAEKLIRENKNIRYAPPQPIVFSNESAAIPFAQNTTVQNAIIENNENYPPFDPTLVFSNGVTKRPEPTPENGVKSDNSGICFRVQIGAFKNRVPQATAEKYFKIKDWPIEVHYINGLYIYTVGNFVGSKYAAKLRDQVVSLGITDAFITVYKDNKKLFGYEAMKYMNQ